MENQKLGQLIQDDDHPPSDKEANRSSDEIFGFTLLVKTSTLASHNP